MSANTGTRKTNRAILKRHRLPCSLQLDGCQGIDYSAKYPHPQAFTVDHIVPLARGGTDVRSNLQPACAHCNWRKNKGADSGREIRRSGSIVIPPELL